jgi:hypothetical protein
LDCWLTVLSSSAGMVPIPGISRSIINFGIVNPRLYYVLRVSLLHTIRMLVCIPSV